MARIAQSLELLEHATSAVFGTLATFMRCVGERYDLDSPTGLGMALRTFVDAAGIEWEVWEVHPTLTERRVVSDRRGSRRDTPDRRVAAEIRVALDQDLQRGWLAFRSRFERRRRTPIPDGWAQVSDDELCALLGQSRFSGPVRRLAE